MSDHQENFEHHETISSTQDEHNHTHNTEPSAPPAASDDNGYIVVQNTQQTSSDPVLEAVSNIKPQEDISNLLADLSANTESNLRVEHFQTVVAEADSSVAKEQPAEQASIKVEEKNKPSSTACSLCPYYLLACDYLTKVQVPPKVRDLVLWKCPKMTGAVFGSSFVLLLSLSLFSFLTVVSSLMLLGLSAVGAYRFYLAVLFRIKGTTDDTLDKFSKCDLSLPKDKVQDLARLLETDFNRLLNRLKSILLWENVFDSLKALVAFYFVNMVGCCFNTLTLLILGLVSLFTLPKVYQVYKQPIDQAIEKGTTCAHNLVKQVLVKIPILNKKKTQ